MASEQDWYVNVLVNGQGQYELVATTSNTNLDDDSHKGMQVGKRGGGWWSTKPGTLKQVLEGQQINPLVLWIVKVESMPNSDLNDDGNRKYLWRMTVSDGKYYFRDAYMTTQHKDCTKRINYMMTVPCEILVFDYRFRVMELPHMKFSNRIHVLELLTFGEISEKSTPYSQSFRRSLLTKELTSDLICAWLHDQPDVWSQSQVIKRISAVDLDRVVDMTEIDIHMSFCHDTSLQLKSSDHEIAIVDGARCYAIPESAVRRVKRGLKRRSKIFWFFSVRNTKKVTRQKDSGRTLYVTPPYWSKHADPKLNQSFSFNVTSKQVNRTVEYLSNNERVCNLAQLVDEHKSIIYFVAAVGIDASDMALFPVYRLLPSHVRVLAQCMKIRITAFRFSAGAKSHSDKPNTVEHVGTYTCHPDAKSDQFLYQIMLNPRTGDIVFAFDEADRKAHGLYYVRVPSSGKQRSGKVNDVVVSMQPIGTTLQGAQWPGAVTHYVKEAKWLWRHNGEQLITLLQAPDRLYVVIFRLQHRSEDNAEVPTIVNAKFISWFEGDTPPRDQGLSTWPPKIVGCYGPFLIFEAGRGALDFFCVRLLSSDLDTMHSITSESCVLLKNQIINFESFIISRTQHLSQITNFLKSKNPEGIDLIVWLHPGGVMIFSLPFWIQNKKTSNHSTPHPMLVRCDISQVLNNYV